MRNLNRISSGLPIQPLLLAVQQQPSLWSEITARQDHPASPHRDTEAIFLRWCEGRDPLSAFTDLHSVEYPAFHALHRQTWPLLDLIHAHVGGVELGRALIVNLKPGGRITPHVDEGIYADHFERFHLVLSSAPGNVFHVFDDEDGVETASMKPGELWWFDHKRVHCVENHSDEPRLHLIVDIVAPKYRRERVPCAAVAECLA